MRLCASSNTRSRSAAKNIFGELPGHPGLQEEKYSQLTLAPWRQPCLLEKGARQLHAGTQETAVCADLDFKGEEIAVRAQ